MSKLPTLLSLILCSCASTTVYFPPDMASDYRGGGHPVARKAIQLYGDSDGPTRIRVTRNSIEYSADGGNNNSAVTATLVNAGASVAKWTIGWGFSYGILNSLFGHAGSAYAAHQAALPKTVGSQPAPLPSVGSTIPAQTAARVVAP